MTSKLFAAAAAGLCLALVPAMQTIARADQGRGNNDDRRESDSRIERGYDIAPVPLTLHGRNRALVGLGSYLVNAVGGCNDCHTWNSKIPPAGSSYAQGNDPFLGQSKRIDPAFYLAGGRFFFSAPYPVSLEGCVISRNLTPQNGKPAGLTREQFVQVMRTGHDPDDKHSPPRLLQVMPWPVYQDMTERDLHAMYEYLSAIPSLPGEPQSQCPTPPAAPAQ